MKSRIVQAIILLILLVAGYAFFSGDSSAPADSATTSGPTP